MQALNNSTRVFDFWNQKSLFMFISDVLVFVSFWFKENSYYECLTNDVMAYKTNIY